MRHTRSCIGLTVAATLALAATTAGRSRPLTPGLPDGAVMQAAPAGRGADATQAGRGRGAPAPAPAAASAPAVPQVSRRPPTDPALVEQGKALWTRECITCHGTNARGTDSGPNLVRSETVNYDRAKPELGLGTVLGPFLKKGHQTQSGKASASFTDQEILQLAHFLSERVNDTMRGSPTYIVLSENVLTGDAKAGEAFFMGEGGCTQCHTATTRSLAGIATKAGTAQNLQALVLYPVAGGGRGGRGRGAAPAAPAAAAVNPLAIATTVTPVGGQPVTGLTVEEDSFFITVRDAGGALKTWRKTPGMKIVHTNPLQWHIEFADRLTDKQMHDLTAYLWSMK